MPYPNDTLTPTPGAGRSLASLRGPLDSGEAVLLCQRPLRVQVAVLRAREQGKAVAYADADSFIHLGFLPLSLESVYGSYYVGFLRHMRQSMAALLALLGMTASSAQWQVIGSERKGSWNALRPHFRDGSADLTATATVPAQMRLSKAQALSPRPDTVSASVRFPPHLQEWMIVQEHRGAGGDCALGDLLAILGSESSDPIWQAHLPAEEF